MSSRAAASRKRLAPVENSRPPSSKGFFSRSKNVPASATHSSDSDQLLVSPTSPSSNVSESSFDSHNGAEINEAYRVNLHYVNSDTTVDKRFRSPTSYAPSSSSISTLYQSPYPSPPHTSDDEFIPCQVPRLGGRPVREAISRGYDGVTYIEASYQPPPPILASYQPPPPSHDDSYAGTESPWKPIRALLPDADAHYTLQTSTPDANIILPLSSQARPSTASLQRLSLTPTEPPTYTSVHEVPYTISSAAVQRQAYDYSPHTARILTSAHSGDHHYHDHTLSFAPPSSRPQRLTPSPFQMMAKSRSHNGLPNPHDHEIRLTWHPEIGRNTPPRHPSPEIQILGRNRSSPADILAAGPSGSPSLSNSDDTSSRKSTASSGKSVKSAPPSDYVYPGSRSVARPKVSKKTASKISANSRSEELETHLPSPSSLSPSSPTRAAFPSDTRQQGYASQFVQAETVPTNTKGIHSIQSVGDSAASSSRPEAAAPATPTKLVYPVARSVAQPSKPPMVKLPRLAKSSFPSTGENGSDGRSKKFMSLLRRKKNKSATTANDVELTSLSHLGISDVNESGARTGLDSNGLPGVSIMKSITLRIGTYPLNPCDTVLLDNDRHTGELLARLNPTNSPCFYNYGSNPPTAVLDLGCGQGHWVVDAAIAWKGYGTKVTGYDMVDLSQGLLPWAAEQGVTESVRFIKGNFLTQRLPFNDNSFDLVRMSCLTLCIPSESWMSVLQEVCRVLMVGGRLEVIDDDIFFPHGNVSDIPRLPQTQSTPPRLNIFIPSASFTTFSIYDGETTNPGLGPFDADDEYFDAEDNGSDVDDTATLNGRELEAAPSSRRNSSIRRNASPRLDAPAWNRLCATAEDVEALFDHMLTHKFGIQKDLSDFIVGQMKEVFGHAREIKTMHLILAPPNAGIENSSAGLRRSKPRTSQTLSTGLSGASGLILWPSTFIPMEQPEIEIHASKHLRMLLSCKDFLTEHALEATDDSEIDEEAMEEALWQYESFLRSRFNPPTIGVPAEEVESSDFDAASIRGSIAESVTSNYREEMWEIQTEFIQRYTWRRPSSSASSSNQSITPTSSIYRASSVPSPPLFTTAPASLASNSSAVMDPLSGEPQAESEEMTHVRTFRVYEATKIDHALFGSVI